jgi:hypothetical protein
MASVWPYGVRNNNISRERANNGVLSIHEGGAIELVKESENVTGEGARCGSVGSGAALVSIVCVGGGNGCSGLAF